MARTGNVATGAARQLDKQRVLQLHVASGAACDAALPDSVRSHPMGQETVCGGATAQDIPVTALPHSRSSDCDGRTHTRSDLAGRFDHESGVAAGGTVAALAGVRPFAAASESPARGTNAITLEPSTTVCADDTSTECVMMHDGVAWCAAGVAAPVPPVETARAAVTDSDAGTGAHAVPVRSSGSGCGDSSVATDCAKGMSTARSSP